MATGKSTSKTFLKLVEKSSDPTLHFQVRETFPHWALSRSSKAKSLVEKPEENLGLKYTNILDSHTANSQMGLTFFFPECIGHLTKVDALFRWWKQDQMSSFSADREEARSMEPLTLKDPLIIGPTVFFFVQNYKEKDQVDCTSATRRNAYQTPKVGAKVSLRWGIVLSSSLFSSKGPTVFPTGVK